MEPFTTRRKHAAQTLGSPRMAAAFFESTSTPSCTDAATIRKSGARKGANGDGGSCWLSVSVLNPVPSADLSYIRLTRNCPASAVTGQRDCLTHSQPIKGPFTISRTISRTDAPSI